MNRYCLWVRPKSQKEKVIFQREYILSTVFCLEKTNLYIYEEDEDKEDEEKKKMHTIPSFNRIVCLMQGSFVPQL